jgi:alkanesulfonate monooxygenase SsuD/methylene tetrahydromethanopterin reductase-like flavin-dependent oxidoreductase (luciferase family)
VDYGHDLRFGVFVPPEAARLTGVVAATQEAELRGLDSVSVQDHPYQPAYVDTWTLLTHLAALTERITLFPNVANLPLRPPAVLAKSAATLDLLSSGRVELGLGAGGFWDAIEAYGGTRLTPGEAVDALEEGVAVVRAIWGQGPKPAAVKGARPGPAPAHPIAIHLGAYKPKMLRLTGKVADGWLPSLGYIQVEELAAANATIDRAARDAGREPTEIRRLLNVMPDALGGGPRQWVEQLAGLALDEGMSHFVLAVDPDDLRTLAAYAEEVAPAVRELVEAERVTPGSRPAAAPVEVSDGALEHEMGDGDRLVAIHDHLRQELQQVQGLVEQVARGKLDAGRARGAINEMTMRQNDWTLGTYCESYCRLVTMHHTIEDTSMYPRLLAADPSLQAPIDKMVLDHQTIHGRLDDLDRALVALVTHPHDGVEGVRAALDRLSEDLLTHLGFEEEQLVEPLNRLGFGI